MAVLLAIGAAVAWLRPYGTRDFELIERFAFWMLAIPLIGLVVEPAIRFAVRHRISSTWHPALQALAGTVLASLPSAGVAILLQAAFGHPPKLAPTDLLALYGSVTTMIALISVPLTIINTRRARAQSGPALPPQPAMEASEAGAGPGADGQRFIRRIPARLGTDLLSIATEDHYLRITTALGSDLILFRMSDAVAELDPAMGQQVHRSYWVARRAVATVERNGHRAQLVLTNGTRIPVSRTYMRQLRRAGWLDS
ncbi:MAG: LytTR family transcriptional regulator [Proteobacteria bacterium]|nr:LytTR family transcriptional regulator [Pseudomonadota bacterium]MBI3497627.1 LytTR family transcriptional regulator [Pseudomonadota bacterium]